MMAHGLRCTGWRPRGAECTGRLDVRKQRPADGERVVIRVQPIDPVTFERQRREALFRSLDNDTDGRISISEAKVNHQFVDAFARLDRDGNGGIDRQEFERVQLEDDAKSARVAR